MPDTDRGPGRPAADECLPYYFQYIRLVPDGHIVETLARQVAESAAFLHAFTPEQALWREAPGEWNILQIVGHMADTERVFGYGRCSSRAPTRSCGWRSSSRSTPRSPTSPRARSVSS
jgi:hypothetical protein